MRIRLDLEYDGANYAGWQAQAGRITIQSSLEKAISTLITSICKKKGLKWQGNTRIVASGRTDAGVHALGQVVAFDWPKEIEFSESKVKYSLNGILKPDIRVRDCLLMGDSFHPRFDAVRKWYLYRIRISDWDSPFDAPYCHRETSLNVSAMFKAAEQFIGEWDFSAFRASDCNASSLIREIYHSEFTRGRNEILEYKICGNGFLKQMVRIIVGTLLEVGNEKRSFDSIEEILKSRDRTKAGKTAPAKGLFLYKVEY